MGEFSYCCRSAQNTLSRNDYNAQGVNLNLRDCLQVNPLTNYIFVLKVPCAPK